MRKIIKFNQGVIAGYDARALIEIIPEVELQFTQRKQYDEYYFEPIEVELNIDQIEALADKFQLLIGMELEIQV